MKEREYSLLNIVRQCHNHDPWAEKDHWTPFLLTSSGPHIGFLPPSVERELSRYIKTDFHKNRHELLELHQSSGKTAFTFCEETNDYAKRSAAMEALANAWRSGKIFPDPLDGWRNELYTIYGPQGPAFAMERAACALLGFATFGVHMTAYTSDLRIWVPRRAKTKATWPGYLDNSVAGGITAGDLPRASMLRECEEEANLRPETVEPRLKQTGVISYFYLSEAGFLQPEVEYAYDLLLPDDVICTPADGEAESFELMDHRTVLQIIKRGEFKANCSLVLIDWFIRHGLLTCENEPQYLDLVNALHNDLKLPGP